MKKNNDKQRASRRSFLKSGASLSVAAITGLGIVEACKKSEEESGEKVKLLDTEGNVVEVDKTHVNHCMHSNTPVDRKKAREGIPYRKFVMVVDLSRCKNARKCVGSCQKAHHLKPNKEWISVYKMQDNNNTAPYWFPKTCYHCDQAPCVDVCPVGASFKRSDGLVLVDTDQCIGCKYCMVACPYSARSFNFEHEKDIHGSTLKYSPETSIPIKTGTVGKCDFCPDMLRENKLPHCITACPMGTLYFGDLNEDTVTNGTETVRFSELMRDKGGYRYMEYFGTEPNVYYLPPVDRSVKFEEGLNDSES